MNERPTVLQRAPGEGLLDEIEPALILQGVRQRSALDRAHFIAVKNWLGKYRPAADVFGRSQVQRYREAYYHLREVGAWREAIRVMRVSIRVQKQVAGQRWQRFEEMMKGEGRQQNER